MVWVGPPLSASVPRPGSATPTRLPLTPFVRPLLPPPAPIRLFALAEDTVPLPSRKRLSGGALAPVPSVFSAMIVLFRVAVPWSTLSPPPKPEPVLGSVLSAIVQLTAFSVPAFSSMPAPTFPAELPATVLLVIFSVPPFSYSPPPGPEELVTELPERVLSMIVSAPAFAKMPPPPAVALLPESVLPEIETVPPSL